MAKPATKKPAASGKPKNFKASLETKAGEAKETKQQERAETHPPRVRRKQ